MNHDSQARSANPTAPYRTIRAALLVGMSLSLLTMAAGMLLAVAKSEYSLPHFSLSAMGSGLARLEAGAMIDLGALLLIATPMLGVLAALLGFIRGRDRAAFTALLVLIALASSFLLSHR